MNPPVLKDLVAELQEQDKLFEYGLVQFVMNENPYGIRISLFDEDNEPMFYYITIYYKKSGVEIPYKLKNKYNNHEVKFIIIPFKRTKDISELVIKIITNVRKIQNIRTVF